MNLKLVLITEFGSTPCGNHVRIAKICEIRGSRGSTWLVLSSALACPSQVDRVVQEYMLRIW